MKIVLLSTVRGQRAEALHVLREELGIAGDPAARVTLVGWHPPRHPLPVDRHLILGGRLRANGNADVRSPAPTSRPEPEVLLQDAGLEDGPRGAEGLTEAVVSVPALVPVPDPATDGVGSSTAAPSVAGLPHHHPTRVAHAVRWRARRVRNTVRSMPAVQRVQGSTKVRKVTSRITSLPSQYAIRALQAPNVRAAVAEADLVVAMDANTYRAAWLLARRHPQPAVLAGAAAGARYLTTLRDGTAG